MFGYRSIIYILGIIVVLPFSIFFSHAGYISLSPSSQTLTLGNPYQFQIYLHTEGQEETVASDIKFFLYGLSFVGFTSMPGFDTTIYLGTGLSTTGSSIGQTYYYINAYQNSFANHISGNIAIGNITLIPKLGYTTGAIVFYDLLGNHEDSNISVGIDPGVGGYPMKYIDTLSHVINGTYSIISSTPSGGGGGGGGCPEKDNCTWPESDFACANNDGLNGEGIDYSESYYDATCCTPSLTGHDAAECDISDSPYDDQELNDAFQRSYSLNITNKCPITEARLEYPLTRIEAAKMMSMFTIQVIGLYPNTNKSGCDTYSDIQTLNNESKFFIKTACQLDIMGLKSDGQTPDEQFNPYEQVDRAQFGTMLSRLIYGDKYNIYPGEDNKYQRYEKHLSTLNKDEIMHKINNPFMLEQRGRVMLMFYRIYQQDLVAQYRLVAPAHNGAMVLLENIR